MTDWSFDAWPAVVPKWHDGAKVIDREYHVDIGCGTLKKGRIGIDRYPAPGVNVLMDLEDGRVFAMAPEPGRDAAERLGNGWRYRTPGRRDGVHRLTSEYLDYPDVHAPELIKSGWQYAQRRFEPYTICCGLPFEDCSIESIVSHHALEHIGEGFIPLMDDIYRVLKPDGIFTAITPLFPSEAAVADPDHCRYFMEGTWESFCGTPGDQPNNCMLASFSVPYTRSRFEKLEMDCSPPTPVEDQWTKDDRREMRVTLRAVK